MDSTTGNAEAGPSRLPARATTRVPSRAATRAAKQALEAAPKPIDVDDDDEPVFVGQSIARKLSERFAFKGHVGRSTSSPVASGDEGPATRSKQGQVGKPSGVRASGRSVLAQRRNGRGKLATKDAAKGTTERTAEVASGKGKAKATEASSDDVEVIQVVEKRKPGRPKKAPLAKAPSKAGARGRTKAATAESHADASDDEPPPPPLQLMPYRDPLPVPPWLGKPAVLLPLRDCPICHKKWTKSEQGVKRWVRSYLRQLHPSRTAKSF